MKSAGKYHLLAIDGRCGRFIPAKTKKLPAGPKRAWDMYQGMCFEPGPGKPDICMPSEDIAHVFVSEKAAEAFRELCDNVTLVAGEKVLSQRSPVELFARKVGRGV